MYDYLYMYMLHDRTEWKGGGGGRGKESKVQEIQVFWFIKTLNTPVKNNLTVVN